MVSPRLGSHSSWASVPESAFPTRKDFGMIAFSKRLAHMQASREEVLQMRTWPWSVKPRKERPKFSRRLTFKEKVNSLGRREI
jgi:hypothetical protein